MPSADLNSFLGELHELPEFVSLGDKSTGPSTRGLLGTTPLHIAAVRGDVRIIELLLDAGAEIDARGEYGHTPLQHAVSQGHIDAVRLLLSRGADIHITNDWGQTAAEIALFGGRQEIESLLTHMSLATVNASGFSFTFPDGPWKDLSSEKVYYYRCGDHEQVKLECHLSPKLLSQSELKPTLIEFVRDRLESAQKHFSTSFESPIYKESPGRFDAQVFGHDLRRNVFRAFGFFSTTQKLVVVLYYDYTGAASSDRFRQRAAALFSTVKVSEKV